MFQLSAVHVLVRVLNFRLNFSPKTSLNIPSSHIVLSLKIKIKTLRGVSRDVCEFFTGLKRLLLGKESSWRFFIRPLALKK